MLIIIPRAITKEITQKYLVKEIKELKWYAKKCHLAKNEAIVEELRKKYYMTYRK